MDPDEKRDTIPAPPPCCLHDETADGVLACPRATLPPAPPSFVDFSRFAEDTDD